MLGLTLDVPPTARVGGPVTFTLALTNDSDEPADAYLRGREIAFDVTIRDRDGRVAWRRLDGLVVPAILQIVTFAPRQTIEMREIWTPRAPGLYSATAAVLTDGAPLVSTAVEFSVER